MSNGYKIIYLVHFLDPTPAKIKTILYHTIFVNCYLSGVEGGGTQVAIKIIEKGWGILKGYWIFERTNFDGSANFWKIHIKYLNLKKYWNQGKRGGLLSPLLFLLLFKKSEDKILGAGARLSILVRGWKTLYINIIIYFINVFFAILSNYCIQWVSHTFALWKCSSHVLYIFLVW